MDTPEPPDAPEVAAAETRSERLRRHSHRMRLYTWAVLLLAALVFLIALILSNTKHVPISWVFGHARASLVWIVVIAAIIGWVLGVATSVLFHRRTRLRR